MSTFSELMTDARITVTSPDGNIRAQVVADFSRLSIAFRPGSYGDYSAQRLAGQLSRLGELARTAMLKTRAAAYRKATDTDDDAMEHGRPHWDSRRREYEAEMNALDVRSFSQRRLLRIRCEGLDRWKVEVKDEALRLDEKDFAAEFAGAFRHLMADHRFKAVLIRTGHFDYGIYPKSMRKALTELRQEYL